MAGAKKAGSLARAYFLSGFNCAEAVTLSFSAIDNRNCDVLLPSLTGFGEGIGRRGCICGALAGGIVALGAVYGRKSLEESEKRSYRLTSQLYDQFVDKYGSSYCRIINKGDFESQEHRIRCSKIVESTVVMVMDIIKKEEATR